MFKIGNEYHRRTEIHGKYKGQTQGGISTPQNHPLIFLFTSRMGKSHGYHDEYRDDGTFWYTGEGQIGDMQMKSGNKAILEHKNNNKTIYLFEATKKAHVKFIGTAECLGFHKEIRPDTNGKDRSAIVFHLDIDSFDDSIRERTIIKSPEPISKLKNKNLNDLRDIAIRKPSSDLPPRLKQQITYYRSQALKKYVILRSKGICEACLEAAPFQTKTGPYLECHHLHRLADGGPDHPQNVVALCPNCHRQAHYSKDHVQFNDRLKSVAIQKEN